MAKSKGKRKGAKQRDDGSAEIKRAEDRLARALADIDTAREKVARRERDLAALMERHGRIPAPDTAGDAAIPLAAPSRTAFENGTADDAAESVGQEPVKQPAAADGAEQHG